MDRQGQRMSCRRPRASVLSWRAILQRCSCFRQECLPRPCLTSSASSTETNLPQAEAHLLCSGTRDSARLLAQVLFEWSRSGADPAAYACRGVMPFLLTMNILASRVFLDRFLSLVLASKPELLLQKDPVSTGAGDEIWVTTDHTLNFLQMAVRICQRADPDSPSESFPFGLPYCLCALFYFVMLTFLKKRSRTSETPGFGYAPDTPAGSPGQSRRVPRSS